MQTVVQRTGAGVAVLDAHRHLQALRTARDLYGLHRVLNFKDGDFQASSKQDLKDAQSYALFSYCLQGAGGRYRERFLAYLREALAGQGQASTCRRIFARDLDALEQAYCSDW